MASGNFPFSLDGPLPLPNGGGIQRTLEHQLRVCYPVQAHIHSVPALQGGERGSGRFRNSDKVAQLEDGRVDVQTQGFGRTLTWLHDPGNSRAIARAILA